MKAYRRLSFLVAAAVAGGFAIQTSTAHANAEVGITAGPHQFSHENELGVPDASGSFTPTSIANSALFGVRLGYYFNSMLGVEVEAGVIPSESRGQPVFDVWVAAYRAHLIAQFLADDPAHHFVPFVVVGAGAMTVLSSGHEEIISLDTDPELYVGAGFKWRVDNGWGLRVDARLLFPPSSAGQGVVLPPKQDAELLLSVYKEFGRKPAVKKEPPPPPGPKDTDGDGLTDDVDKCPNDAGPKENDGCPDKDTDNDGIVDRLDKCPNDAEDKDSFQDADGCPDLDNDSDGVPDAADKCPNDAGPKENDGCPDKDSDSDGIVDRLDKCPDKPETVNGYQDSDGCPDEVPKAIAKFTGTIKGINFKTGSDEILKTSNATLDAAVKVLKDYPDLKLEIQGHTDNQAVMKGSKFADNMALSQARADSVKAYMVKGGIDESRLTAKGYGDTVPIADNKTKAGQAKNRRVEFKLVSALTEGAGAGGGGTPPPSP